MTELAMMKITFIIGFIKDKPSLKFCIIVLTLIS